MEKINPCCCCLFRPSVQDLKTPYVRFGITEIFSDMIQECFQINILLDDDDEYGICEVCASRLRDANDFKLQVQRSQAELRARGRRAVQIKKEQPEVLIELFEDHGTNIDSMLRGEHLVKSEELYDARPSDEMLYEESSVKTEPPEEDGSSEETLQDHPAIPDLRKQHYFEMLDYSRLIVAKTSESSSVQVVVTKPEICEDEHQVPLAALIKTHEEEQEVSDVTSDSNPDLPSASLLDLRNCSKRRLRYSDVYTDSEESEPHHDVSVENIKPGTFVLVKFQLKGRKETEYRYAGICQSSTSDDDGEIKIMFLKVVGDNASMFRPDNKDVSYVRYEDIISILPSPTSYVENEGTYYEFSTKIDVFEK